MNNYSKSKNVICALTVILLVALTGTILIAQDNPEVKTIAKRNLSLENCINIATENNHQLLIINEGLNQADAKVAEAKSRFYPAIALNLTDTRVDEVSSFSPMPGTTVQTGALNSYKGELSIREAIYAGGRISAGVRTAKLGENMAFSGKNDYLRGLKFQVKKAYYDALLNEETVKVNLKSEQAMASHLDEITKQNQVGTASNYDLLRTKVQLANIRTLRIQSQSALDKSYLTLVSIMGAPLSEAKDIALTDKLLYREKVPQLSEMEKTSFENRPDLRAAQLKIDLQTESLKMAKSEHYPSISLSFATGEEYPSRKIMGNFKWGSYWNISGMVSVPIFEGWRVRSRIRQEMSALKQIELSLKDLQERIRFELQQTFLSLKDALASIQSQGENVQQAEEAFRLAEIEYKNGLKTQLDLLDAQIAMDTASKNYVTALYQYNLAQANLDLVIGR